MFISYDLNYWDVFEFVFGHGVADVLQLLHYLVRIASFCDGISADSLRDSIESLAKMDLKLVEIKRTVMLLDQVTDLLVRAFTNDRPSVLYLTTAFVTTAATVRTVRFSSISSLFYVLVVLWFPVDARSSSVRFISFYLLAFVYSLSV